jgi:hypothetical protein
MELNDASRYAFLGPILGITGVLLSAGAAVLFGFTRSFEKWEPPPSVLPHPLRRMITMLCAIGIFLAWILAEPSNLWKYIEAAAWLGGISVAFFLVYVWLWSYCRFRKPTFDECGKLADEEDWETIWGGFWTIKTDVADRNRTNRLKGNAYSVTAVWSQASVATASMTTAFVLLTLMACGSIALSVSAAAAQVALTNKPAREVLYVGQVPGLNTPPSPSASPSR